MNVRSLNKSLGINSPAGLRAQVGRTSMWWMRMATTQGQLHARNCLTRCVLVKASLEDAENCRRPGWPGVPSAAGRRPWRAPGSACANRPRVQLVVLRKLAETGRTRVPRGLRSRAAPAVGAAPCRTSCSGRSPNGSAHGPRPPGLRDAGLSRIRSGARPGEAEWQKRAAVRAVERALDRVVPARLAPGRATI